MTNTLTSTTTSTADVPTTQPPAVDAGFWMKPVSTQIIVERRKERRRRSTILHEVKAAEAPHEGVVRAIGPQVRLPIRLGDVLMFTRFAGQEGVAPIESDVEYVILAEAEVLCVLDDAAMQAREDQAVAREREAAERLRGEAALLRAGK